MKNKQRIDRILETIHEGIQDEVGGLIGAELELSMNPGKLLTKAEFFDVPRGKQVLAHIDITGEVEGKGALLVSVKDAIRLGGTLIMLPLTELEDVVTSEVYDGETEDSYGEIANIIAGVYTKAFEEMYPKSCRFIRKEQEVVQPAKIDPESDQIIPRQMYYQVSSHLNLNGSQLGEMIMLIPADPFELVPESPTETSEKPADSIDASSPETYPEEVDKNGRESEQESLSDEEPPVTEQKAKPSFDVKKHQKKVDTLLELCREKMAEEVGALLGTEIKLSNLDNKLIGKEEFFFEEALGKQVSVDMEVVGKQESKSFLFLPLKDAIRIGCILIMLPPNELETAVTEEDFSVDSEDAYGEIANIISGVYTAVFEEQYKHSLRFIKKDIQTVVPMKVDIASDEPIPDQLYYLSSMQLIINGSEYGKLQMMFPAHLFELETLLDKEEQSVDEALSSVTDSEKQVSSIDGESEGYRQNGGMSTGAGGSADVLIVSDSETDAQAIRAVFDDRGISFKQLTFKDNVNDYLPGMYKAVFLVMRKVDEQAFGMAIKISSACSQPLIAAGPEWTRSKVIKAVKYGVNDILLTPAEDNDIVLKIQNNIFEKAA